MMSNVAENLAKVQGLMIRWSRPSLAVVWGRRQKGWGTETQKQPWKVSMSSCSIHLHNFPENKDSHLCFAKC